MKNLLLLAFCFFLFNSLSYAQDYENGTENYDTQVEPYDAEQEAANQQDSQSFEEQPQDDRVEDVSMNAEEDTSYNN